MIVFNGEIYQVNKIKTVEKFWISIEKEILKTLLKNGAFLLTSLFLEN